MSFPKVITMTAWRRPDCLRQSLDALRKCDGIDDYILLIHLDGPPTSGMNVVCRSIDFCGVSWVQEAGNLGCNRNTFKALADGFGHSDYVIHVEEDVILAPDALRYFEWARDKTAFSVGAWKNDGGGVEHQPERLSPDDPRNWQASRAQNFHIWGWATWHSSFVWMKHRWTTGSDSDLSWDTCISRQMKAVGFPEIVPTVSRATNVGDGGIHRGRAELDYWAGVPEFKRGNFQLI